MSAKEVKLPHTKEVDWNPPSSDRVLKAQSMRDEVSAFCLTHGITIKNKGADEWRLACGSTGQIVGLPMSRGRLAITNGILCYILRQDGSLFLGHLQWFEKDENIVDKRFGPRKIKQLDLSQYETL